MSQGRQARRATASYHAICGARYSVPHRVSTLSVQASPRHGSESIASANIGRNVARVVCTPVLSRQLVQKCSGLLEISCVKALREPAVDRRQQRRGFQALTLALPQAGRAHGGAQFPRLRLLAASHFEGLAPSARSSRQRRGVQLSVPERILHREPLGLGGGHQTIIAGDIRTGQCFTIRFLLRQCFL